MLLPAFVLVAVFHYIPIYGIQMAFKQVRLGQSFLQGEWIGFENFIRFFNAGWFEIIIKNTVVISFVYNFLFWPVPVIFAIMLHNCVYKKIGKFVQTISYMPHLLSLVVVISIVNLFCDGQTGLINILLNAAGHERISFFGREDMVVPLYSISGIWQHMGFSAIVYLAALTTVDTEMMESAYIDGASKFQRIIYIDFPSILPTVITMFILNMGRLFNVGAEKMLLLQTDLNIGASEVITTYVYKAGIRNAQYGFATAVGLFNNVVNFIILVVVNTIAKRISDTSLF